MAKVGLNNESTLAVTEKIHWMEVTVKVSAGHCNLLLLMGDWNRWMMALACPSGFRSFGRDFHNLRKLMFSIVRLV